MPKHTTDAPPPMPDVSEMIRQQKEMFVDTFEMAFKRVSFIVLLGALMMPGDKEDVSYDGELLIKLWCDMPTPGLDINPHWKQYNVNGEWVGNIHGMEKQVTHLCWEQFMSKLNEFLEI